jgi:hypothetical protein
MPATCISLVEVPRELGMRHVEWRHQLRQDPCSYCSAPAGGTVDHIQPRSRGGRDQGPRNVTGSCASCNKQKGATSVLLFLLERVAS